MDIEKRLQLSYYQTIATINEEHKVYVTQNINDKHIYVKKILDKYNPEVYENLFANHINGLPYIYELYQENDTLTVIEEYVSGNTLEELLNQNYKFSVDEIKKIAYQLCIILERLHNCNPSIIHRDIKPSNIILKTDGTVVLLDLNAAKHISTNKNEDTLLLGTKGYAAPEQYGFGTSSPQTDIYALGMVINTLMFGEFSHIAYENSELTKIIKKCIQLNPKDRYSSISQIRHIFKTNDFNIEPVVDAPWKKFLPIGFRSLNPINMFMASAFYMFLAWLCLTLEVESQSLTILMIERISLLIIFLGVILISSNYLGIHKKLPLCRSKNNIIKIMGIIIYDYIYAVIMIVIMAILVTSFS